MTGVYPFKVGDLLPSLIIQLWDPPASPGAIPVPADLSDATEVYFRIRSMRTGQMKVDNIQGNILPGGKVEYPWQDAEEVDEAGLFEAEVTLTFPTGEMTYPPDGYFLLRGVDRLGAIP